MRTVWLVCLLLAALVAQGEAKRKRKFVGDFEFAEEVSTSFLSVAFGQ